MYRGGASQPRPGANFLNSTPTTPPVQWQSGRVSGIIERLQVHRRSAGRAHVESYCRSRCAGKARRLRWASSSRCCSPGYASRPLWVSGSIHAKTYGSAVHTIFQILAGSQIGQGIWTYGEAPRHEVMVMLDNFPEKGGSMGARRVHKSLKRQNLSSASFPKRRLLGRVSCSLCSPTVALLP